MPIGHYKTYYYGLRCVSKVGLFVGLGFTLLGGSGGLIHSPPHQEIPHVEPAQHAPENTGRYIPEMVTSASPLTDPRSLRSIDWSNAGSGSIYPSLKFSSSMSASSF
jgi:hypothetical protein